MQEDNFIAQVYTSYQSEYHFLALYTVLNCYCYVLAYMYAPTRAQARESRYVKEANFAMIEFIKSFLACSDIFALMIPAE